MIALLADDEHIQTDGLCALLRDRIPNIEIEKASNGWHGLNILKNKSVDIAFVDIRMPVMDGLTMIREYQRLQNPYPTKFIILSGYEEFSYARQAIGLGVAGYLLKPVDIAELEELLDKTLGITLNNPALSSEGSQDVDMIRDVLAYINGHYMQAISMEALAQMVYFNPSYFSAVFKKRTGMTFSRYLMVLRLEHAEKLLRDTDRRVYEISRDVGYEDPKYFIRLFKREYGSSPDEYRRLYRLSTIKPDQEDKRS